jgi:hypothetical protein
MVLVLLVALDHSTCLRNKLREFEIISKKVTKTLSIERSRYPKDIVIMLLHYSKWNKRFLHPSAAGFLFESFIAGLIPKSFVADDNGIADIVAEGRKYQSYIKKSKCWYNKRI